MRLDTPYVPPYHPTLLESLDTETAQVHILLGELRSLTKWPLPVLCRHLGCDPASKPAGIPAVVLLKHSVAYLKWVTELCNLVDRPEDRHDILLGAFDMVAGAGGPLDDRVARCRRAFQTPIENQTSNELVELGEVHKAWQLAARALDGGRSVSHQQRLSAPLDELTAHLHPRRLQVLFGDAVTAAERLGPTVAQRMHAHLRGCERCKAVVAQLGLASSATAA
jgi:hypothetical protein